MSLMDRLEGMLILGPIIAMLALGMVLTLRSGVVSLSTGQGMRRVVENLFQTLLILGVFLVIMALIQQLVGMRLGIFGI
jgi:hypothetical protein